MQYVARMQFWSNQVLVRLFSLLLATAATIPSVATAAEPGAGAKLIQIASHSVSTGERTTSAHVQFGDDVFMVVGSELYRLKDGETSPTRLTMPDLPGRYSSRVENLILFDGALFFTASRYKDPEAEPTSPSFYRHKPLFRLDSPDGVATRVDIDEPVRRLTEHNGVLYALTQTENDSCAKIPELADYTPYYENRYGTGYHHKLFRFTSSDAESERINWSSESVGCDDISEMRSTSSGLMIRGFETDQVDFERSNNIYLLRNPQTTRVDGTSQLPARRIISRRVTGFYSTYLGSSPYYGENTDDHIVFGERVFFSGQHDAMIDHPVSPLPGPYPAPEELPRGMRDSGLGYEAELYSLNLGSQELSFFDLNAFPQSVLYEFVDGLDGRDIGGSYPESLYVAYRSLYFATLPNELYPANGELPGLYRLRGPGLIPKALKFGGHLWTDPHPGFGPGSFDTTDVHVHGVYFDRLWVTGTSKAGFGLHYIANDGVTPVLTSLPASMATSASGFGESDTGVMFGAQDENFDWYSYRIELPVNPIVQMTLDGDRRGKTDPLVADAGSRIRASCEIHNISNRQLEQIQVTIRAVLQDVGTAQPQVRTRSCVINNLGAGASTECSRAIYAAPGQWRYGCTVEGIDAEGGQVDGRSRAFSVNN